MNKTNALWQDEQEAAQERAELAAMEWAWSNGYCKDKGHVYGEENWYNFLTEHEKRNYFEDY